MSNIITILKIMIFTIYRKRSNTIFQFSFMPYYIILSIVYCPCWHLNSNNFQIICYFTNHRILIRCHINNFYITYNRCLIFFNFCIQFKFTIFTLIIVSIYISINLTSIIIMIHHINFYCICISSPVGCIPDQIILSVVLAPCRHQYSVYRIVICYCTCHCISASAHVCYLRIAYYRCFICPRYCRRQLYLAYFSFAVISIYISMIFSAVIFVV